MQSLVESCLQVLMNDDPLRLFTTTTCILFNADRRRDLPQPVLDAMKDTCFFQCNSTVCRGKWHCRRSDNHSNDPTLVDWRLLDESEDTDDESDDRPWSLGRSIRWGQSRLCARCYWLLLTGVIPPMQATEWQAIKSLLNGRDSIELQWMHRSPVYSFKRRRVR